MLTLIKVIILAESRKMKTHSGKRIRKGNTNYQRLKENKLFFRTKGLDKLQERFDEDIIGYMTNLSKNKKEARILELGFGEGKALLESMNLGKNIWR